MLRQEIVRAQELLSELSELYKKIYNECSATFQEIRRREFSSEELTDIGFLFREMENIGDTIRKESKGRKELCAKLICAAVVEASLNDPTDALSRVDGRLATFNPNVKFISSLPKKDDPEYDEFLEWIGVSKEVIAKGLLNFRFNEMCDLLTHLVSEGKPVPKGFKNSVPMYGGVYRRRKSKFAT